MAKEPIDNLIVPDPLKVPAIKNIAELLNIKRAPRKPLLIHFSADQWKQVTKGIREVKSLPKKGFRLVGFPDPDGSVILRPECVESGPEEECILRIVPRLGSPRGIGFECMCRPKDFLPPVAKPLCTLEIGFKPLRFYCRTGTCAGNCQLQIVRNQGGFRPILVCACV